MSESKQVLAALDELELYVLDRYDSGLMSKDELREWRASYHVCREALRELGVA